jgi:mutator protein MutT
LGDSHYFLLKREQWANFYTDEPNCQYLRRAFGASTVAIMNEIVLRVAAKALIVNDEGKVLILREAATYKEGTNTGRYHLPGGRIEAGEAFFDALAREVREETGLSIEPVRPLYVGEWRPVINGVPNQIIALFMLCKTATNEIVVSDEHDQAAWINPADFAQYDLMTPDNKVIDTYLKTT